MKKFPATGNPQIYKMPKVSVIQAPPDSCPDCLERNIPANYSWTVHTPKLPFGQATDTLYGRYTHCGIQWDTGWNIRNLG